MIKREHFVVIIDTTTRGIRSIEARCDTMENAELFMEENAYILTDLNRPYNPKRYEFAVNEVVVIKGDK